MASIRQWDTDHMDQFKTIFPTTFTNLQIYPGNPIDWIKVNDIMRVLIKQYLILLIKLSKHKESL